VSRFDVGDYELGKTRLLSRQCATCILRPGNPFAATMRPGRMRQFLTQAQESGFVVCHSTIHGIYPDAKPAVCRGFYDRFKTTTLHLIERLWGFVEVEPPGETQRTTEEQ
jgi:hypothetical protein